MSKPGISRRAFLIGTAAVGSMGMGKITPADKSPTRNKLRKEWQIGCYTRPWAEYEYKAALDGIVEAGFKYVGLMTTKSGLIISSATRLEDAGRVGEEIHRRKLRVLSVYGGDLPVKEGLAAATDAMRKLIDNCAAVGSATLLMGGVGDEKAQDVYYKAIATTCEYAASKQLEITLKPHGGLNATGPQCRKVIEKVNHPNFRLWYDAGNILYYSDGQLDPVEDAATVDGVVTGMCVKDYLPPKNVSVTPGDGKVKFQPVLARLKRGGFAWGPLVVETLAPAANPAGIVEQARRARKFVEKFVRQV